MMWLSNFFPVWKWFLIIVVVLAIAYIGICILLVLVQRRLIFVPSSVIQMTPENVQLRYEDVWLPVSSQEGKLEEIHGWWIPANSAKQDVKRVLLYLHGNGVNIGVNVEQAYRFYKLGFDVFLVDYRGYGLSRGNFPSEVQVYQDVEIVWDYLINQRGINPKNIVVYGHSLGGAIAIELGTRYPEMAGLIIQSSFTSMADVVNNMGNYRIFPIDLLLHQRFDSISKLRQLEIPIMLIHGREDRLVPADMSEKLFAVSPAKIKDLYLVADAGHNNVAATAGDKYLDRVSSFVSQLRQQEEENQIKNE
ncbi:MAG: alpha/beta fold hydrolase [Microcoleaceae cyanobacterium MO_207.B10]|nr:alpha/beta fold hydrolase [Microcoleaceae cyanobacterium MO_207.B10]